VLKTVYVPSLGLDTALIMGGIALQVGLAFWLEWLGHLEKRVGPRPNASAKPAIGRIGEPVEPRGLVVEPLQVR
jgi:hypothetical protein